MFERGQFLKRTKANLVVAVLRPLALGSIVFSSFALSASVPAYSFDKQHRLFTAELKKYVDDDGVHYAKWRHDMSGLLRYLQELADITPAQYDRLSFKERAALWMNAYDALTLKIILDHYPIRGNIPYFPVNSPRQIPEIWDAFPIEIAGRKLTLSKIEHDILRREIKDVRTHFVVACAARGCGAAPRSAFTASNWNKRLKQETQRFLADKHNLELDETKKEVRVSKIFKWFPLDFAVDAGFKKIPFPPPSDDTVILGYLALHGPKHIRMALKDPEVRKSYTVAYPLFDWGLNDADAAHEQPK